MQKLFQKTIEDFDCKIMAKLYWQLACTTWAGQTGHHKLEHRVFSILLQLLLAATGLLEEKVLLLMLFWSSSRVKLEKVLLLNNFWLEILSHSNWFFSHVKWNQSKQYSLLCLIFLSFLGLCLKVRNREESACAKVNPVQSSRSQLTTCSWKGTLWKGTLLRFQSSSTASSDAGMQKLGNNLWYDSALIATKIPSQICSK